MKRVGIILALLVAGGIVVGIASPRDISTVETAASPARGRVVRRRDPDVRRGPVHPQRLPAWNAWRTRSSTTTRPCSATAIAGSAPGPMDVVVPLNLNPGPHSVVIKVEVNGEITYLSDTMIVTCP